MIPAAFRSFALALAGLAVLLVTAVASPGRDPVVGTYNWADGFVGCRLELLAAGRFTVGCFSDSGEVREARGTFVHAGRRITLRSAPGSTAEVPDELVTVPWPPRLYLVPKAKLIQFCNRVNAGGEPSQVWWIFRRAGPERPTVGRPEVPAAFRGYLLPSPLQGQVLEIVRPETDRVVGTCDCKRTEVATRALVRIDLGAAAGLKTGMVLFAADPRRPKLRADLRVTEVAERSALAEAEYQFPEVRVGDRVSTREPEPQSE